MLLRQMPFGSLAISASTASRERVADVVAEPIERVDAEFVHHLDQALQPTSLQPASE